MDRRNVRRLALALATVLTACAPVDDGPTGNVSQSLMQCATNTVEGVDVYDGDGTIDWAAAHGAGIRWASVKATQGTYNTQSRFNTNRANAHAAGVYVAPYHFFDPTEDGVAQAHHFLSVVGTLGALDMPAVLDVECPDGDANCLGTGNSGAGASAATLRSRILGFLTTVESATGRTPIIYTFGSYFSSNSIVTTGFDHYPLWIAYPTVTTHCGTGGTSCFNVPSPWTRAVAWQWTWHGCVSGIGGEVDRDRFIGTMAELTTFAGGGARYQATFVAQSWPLASMPPARVTAGQQIPAWIDLRNTGTATWDANTRFATTVARDRVSPFAGPDWVATNRPAQVTGTVAPGATYRFHFTWTAPAMPGNYDEHYGMVEDHTAWFSDPGQGGPADSTIEALFTVVAAPDAGTVTDASMVTDASVADADDAASSDDTGPTDDTGTSVVDAGEHESGADAASARDASHVGDGGDGGDGGVAMNSGGCHCSVPGVPARSPSRVPGVFALAGLALAFGRRRR